MREEPKFCNLVESAKIHKELLHALDASYKKMCESKEKMEFTVRVYLDEKGNFGQRKTIRDFCKGRRFPMSIFIPYMHGDTAIPHIDCGDKGEIRVWGDIHNHGVSCVGGSCEKDTA